MRGHVQLATVRPLLAAELILESIHLPKHRDLLANWCARGSFQNRFANRNAHDQRALAYPFFFFRFELVLSRTRCSSAVTETVPNRYWIRR